MQNPLLKGTRKYCLESIRICYVAYEPAQPNVDVKVVYCISFHHYAFIALLLQHHIA